MLKHKEKNKQKQQNKNDTHQFANDALLPMPPSPVFDQTFRIRM